MVMNMYYELETLEFNKVLSKIKGLSSLDRTKAYIEEIKPSNELNIIQEALDETSLMRDFIVKFGELPFGLKEDVFKYIEVAKKGGTLSINEINLINELVKTTKFKS